MAPVQSKFAQPSDKKRFKCDLCPMSFTQSSHLKRYKNCLHTHEVSFDCSLCPRKFYRKDKLRLHLLIHVKENIPPIQGLIQGAPVGPIQGAPVGLIQGAPVGPIQGAPVGLIQGAPVGLIQGAPVGLIQGAHPGGGQVLVYQGDLVANALAAAGIVLPVDEDEGFVDVEHEIPADMDLNKVEFGFDECADGSGPTLAFDDAGADDLDISPGIFELGAEVLVAEGGGLGMSPGAEGLAEGGPVSGGLDEGVME